MITVWQGEGTARDRTLQGVRKLALLPAFVCALAALPSDIRAQQLPYAVTIVDWSPHALHAQRRAYRLEAKRHEVLFCVDMWVVDTTAGLHRVVIHKVRRETAGEAHGVANAGQRCVGAQGERLPMIHTHSDGNCQLSPSDLAMIAARGAPFDGVQCGEHHFVWAYAWQIKAIANSFYLDQRAQTVPDMQLERRP